ncbi:MAG: hypothetical protein ACM31D_18240, partial [Bacteroidota bacterium]
MTRRTWLTVAAVLDFTAAALHLAIVVGGADWYRFFGAGEDFASRAERGDPLPAVVTVAIAMILSVWGLYCLQLAGRLRLGLPWPRLAVTAITTVYGLRALAPLIAWVAAPQALDAFLVWSSLVCLGFALSHGMGLVPPAAPA